MANIKIPYFVRRKRQNNTAYYWQPDTILRKKGWKHRRLSNIESEAITQAQTINIAVDQQRAGIIDGPVNERPGSIDAVIASYRKSREFLSLSDKTRKDYGRFLNAISDWAGSDMASSINKKMVQDLYEEIRVTKPRKAAYLVQVLRLLFSYAERQSIIPINSNPATKPALSYKAAKGQIWTPEDVRDFVAAADATGNHNIGTAVMLNEWLGQRRGDIIKMPLSAYIDGAFHITQSKTKAQVVLPVDMVPQLKARLELQLQLNKDKKGKTIIQQQDGRAYTDDGFMSAFERIRTEAGKKNKRLEKLLFKDLRHTAVTRLAESGAEIPQIASVTGHSFKSCQDIVDRYNIRTKKMSAEAFSKRITAGNAEGKKSDVTTKETGGHHD